MIELTASHFDEVCRGGPVQAQLGTVEVERSDAIRKFWLYLIGGTLLAIAMGLSLIWANWPTLGLLAGIAMFVGAIIVSLIPMNRVKKAIKLPVLEAIAKKGSMEYLAEGFDPPVYPNARGALFGSALSEQTFSDMFWGTDAEGHRFAFYEASLARGSGKSRQQVFSGQVYAFQRRTSAQAVTVIVPDRGLFNFFKPSGGMERVRIDGDPEFEKKFEVYSTEPMRAAQVLDAGLRRQLLELRQSGRVFGYVGPADALVAVTGKNRFEPGSMFRSRTGQERARMMFDDVCASMQLLKRLKDGIG
jgi:hypothetical protein